MKSYLQSARALARFLAQKQLPNGAFPSKTFYGEVFAIALWARLGGFDSFIYKALGWVQKKEKTSTEFHWEFWHYALNDSAVKPYLSESFQQEIERFPYKGTSITNWSLLRAVDRLHSNNPIERTRGWLDGRLIITTRQDSQGLFWDQRQAKSLHYHAFSTMLCAELFELTNDQAFRDAFEKGIELSLQLILDSGRSLYIGRGQEQLFGYGALLMALEYAQKMGLKTGNASHRVWKMISNHQRKNGSFPLVLNVIEKIEKDPDVLPHGWYTYNHYYDYLPFFGYFLSRLQLQDKNRPEKNEVNYSSNEFLVQKKEGLQMVISRPIGFWSNSQITPFVSFKQRSPLPCTGGEELNSQKAISSESIPLPLVELKSGETKNGFLMHWRIQNNTLYAQSSWMSLKRTFQIQPNSIEWDDTIQIYRPIKKARLIRIPGFNWKKQKNGWKSIHEKVEVTLNTSVIFTPSKKYHSPLGDIGMIEWQPINLSKGTYLVHCKLTFKSKL